MPGPHDALFRRTFSDPTHAVGALRRLLPEPLAAALNWDELEVSSGVSFVDETLSDRQVDLLYQVPLGEHPALVYILFEHQSTSDPRMPARLFIYVARVVEDWLRKNPQTVFVPPVIPIVLHHSNTGWVGARALSEMYDLGEEHETLVPYLPELRFALDDLSKETDHTLVGRALTAMSRLVLLALRDSRRTVSDETLQLWAVLIREIVTATDGVAALESVFRYVAETRDGDIIDALVEYAGAHEVEEVAMTLKQRLIAEGREEGRREALRLQIRLKFGAVEPSDEARLVAATVSELDAWTARVLGATHVRDLFDD